MKTTARRRTATISVLALGLLGWFGSPGAGQPSSNYSEWTIAGTSGDWTGTSTPPAGFPAANLTSDSSDLNVRSGTSHFLGPETPFGSVFGSSEGTTYLGGTTSGTGAPSTTTITFAEPTPIGNWGFAIGDIDVDAMTITATDADGNVIPSSALGFQGVFNYCAFSPMPPGCVDGPSDAVPTWDPDTATLTGPGGGSIGASGWFQPTVAIGTLTLIFSPRTGNPSFQLWMASQPEPPAAADVMADPATPTLPNTGTDLGMLVLVGLSLIAGGAALVVLRRYIRAVR